VVPLGFLAHLQRYLHQWLLECVSLLLRTCPSRVAHNGFRIRLSQTCSCATVHGKPWDPVKRFLHLQAHVCCNHVCRPLSPASILPATPKKKFLQTHDCYWCRCRTQSLPPSFRFRLRLGQHSIRLDHKLDLELERIVLQIRWSGSQGTLHQQNRGQSVRSFHICIYGGPSAHTARQSVRSSHVCMYGGPSAHRDHRGAESRGFADVHHRPHTLTLF